MAGRRRSAIVVVTTHRLVHSAYGDKRGADSGASYMKKLLAVVLVLIAVLAAYFGLPLTSVAVLTVTLTDQNGGKITADASATYLDGGGNAIVTIAFGLPSWDNNLHWWAHSRHPASRLRPEDAKRAVSVRIEAKGCETVTIPVSLERSYEPPSPMPHGGGAAYFIYRFNGSVVLRCG
jgi:hypothetical protein